METVANGIRDGQWTAYHTVHVRSGGGVIMQ
jgi:hypothetical protein